MTNEHRGNSMKIRTSITFIILTFLVATITPNSQIQAIQSSKPLKNQVALTSKELSTIRNNNFDDATIITIPITITEYLQKENNERSSKIYQFNINESQLVAGKAAALNMTLMTTSSTNFDLFLYNASQQLVASSQSTGKEKILLPSNHSNIWWLEVSIFFGNGGNFSLNIDILLLEPLDQHDAGTIGDASDTFANSRVLPAASSLLRSNGTIDPAFGDDVDVYRFNVKEIPSPDTYVVISLFSPPTGDFDLGLIDGNFKLVDTSTLPESQPDLVVAPIDSTGEWIFFVISFSGIGGPYRFSFEIREPFEQNDGNSGVDAGTNPSKEPFLENDSYVGTIDPIKNDFMDVYQIAVNANAPNNTVHVVLFSDIYQDLDLQLIDPSGNIVIVGSRKNSTIKHVLFQANVTGTWKIVILWNGGGGGNYTISLMFPVLNSNFDTTTNQNSGKMQENVGTSYLSLKGMLIALIVISFVGMLRKKSKSQR